MSWNLEILPISEHIQGVANHSERFGDLNHRGTQVGTFLLHGFRSPEAMISLETIVEESFWRQNYRTAIPEAISLAELVIFTTWGRFRDYVKLSKSIDDPNGHTWKYLSEKIVPVLLSCYAGDRGPIMSRLNEATRIRHNVVHKGYQPSPEEMDLVVSIVRLLISIFEIPNKFKGDWLLRADMPQLKALD